MPASVGSKEFVFGSGDPTCQLPCWQELVVGEAGPEDIQAVFDTTFGFNGTREFLPEGRSGEGGIYPGLILANHAWVVSTYPEEFLVVTFRVNQDTLVLEGIEIGATVDEIDRWFTPQLVLQDLGVPDHFLVSIRPTTFEGFGRATLVIIYEEGIVFRMESVVTAFARPFGDPPPRVDIEICLSGEQWNESIPGRNSSVFLMYPFEDGLGNYQGIYQRDKMNNLFEELNPSPIEELFDLTLDEIVDLAMQPGPACMAHEVEAE